MNATEWICEIGSTVPQETISKLSDVISFDNQTIADAIKTGYDTWKVPYIVDTIASTDARYSSGKRFLIRFGLPSQEILDENARPFVFQMGQGVGLKNNSRTPKNNKIITRIAGYGSENNIPYGYPQIEWYGNPDWEYTEYEDEDFFVIENGVIQNRPTANAYPLYMGIVGGRYVKLIKHPFTRSHLMPSIYSETLFNKVSPYLEDGTQNPNYDQSIELKDYYDAINDGTHVYPNPINPNSPSYDIHEFEDIKPELGEATLAVVSAYDDKNANAVSLDGALALLKDYYTESANETEKSQLSRIISILPTAVQDGSTATEGTYSYDWSLKSDSYYAWVQYTSSILNFSCTVLRAAQPPVPDWDDTMDDDGKYKQSYFKVTLPCLSFDLYACAAITQEMSINMRSGACIGCTFPIMVDWDDYKKNFYDADGNFDPAIGEGHPRNGDKYPNSATGQITVILQKDNNTFGTLMPNKYQYPLVNDKFVILGISLPTSYISNAESRLDDQMVQYMADNNKHYFEYPLKFDEHFLATNTDILAQMKCNTIVRFRYNTETIPLYIKQISVKFGQAPLPQYDITLTDDIQVVLNSIGKAIETFRTIVDDINNDIDIDSLFAQFDGRYLSKLNDDTAAGFVRLLRGLQAGERFVTGLLGEGGVFRTESDGTTYLEVDKIYVRMKASFDTVELRRFTHSNGNRIASLAGVKCSRVEYIDADGDVTEDSSMATKFRCYFRANDNGETVTNDFVVGDLAFCKETNADVSSGVQQHGYWRAVVGKNATITSNGEAWIDLSANDCLQGSDIPLAQDDIVQLGNKTDTTRQGAIIEYVGGADAPSYQIYQNINTYSLENKNYVAMGYNSSTGRAYLNVYGDFRFGSKDDNGSYLSYNPQTGVLNVKAVINAQSTIGNQSIDEYIKGHQNNYDDSWIQPALDDIQSQIDGELDTWYYEGVPTLNNLPASQWTTNDLKKEHVGDLYYDKNTGYAYRFVYDTSVEPSVFKWTQIHDDAISEALKIAGNAQQTADNKRRVFICDAQHQTPTPPYDDGDLWVNVKYPWATGATYNGDILKCINAVASDGRFNINHWTKASDYTDDTTVNAIIVKYGEILNIQATSQNVGESLGYLRKVLSTGSTSIDGGLVLTNIIYMKDTAQSPSIWAGISGTYMSNETGTGYKGHGTAAWYGGGVNNGIPIDHEVSASLANYAKTLFRFDGSGYVAGGNLSWDNQGKLTIKQVYWGNEDLTNFFNSFSVGTEVVESETRVVITPKGNVTLMNVKENGLVIGGSLTYDQNGNVTGVNAGSNGEKYAATRGWVAQNYVSIAYFNRLFQAYNSSTISDENKVIPNDVQTTINNLKIMVGAWTEQYLSVLGQNNTGGGGITLNEPLQSINNAQLDTHPQTSGQTIVWNGSAWVYGTAGGSGTVTAVKVGTTTYNPTNGVVSLPAYLPLSGGTLTGGVTFASNTLNTFGSNFKVGDINIGGTLGLKGANGQTSLAFVNQNNNYYVKLVSPVVAENKTVNLPSASGTIALTSQIPTSLPASDVYAWAKATTKPSYDLDEVGDGNTRKLSDYQLKVLQQGSANQPVYVSSNGTFAVANAYPTRLPASDVYAWAKAENKPTYNLDEISDGSTRRLSNYAALNVSGSLFATGTNLNNVATEGTYYAESYIKAASLTNSPYNYSNFKMLYMKAGHDAYGTQIVCGVGMNRWYSRSTTNTGSSWTNWDAFAYTSDNVASATKLQTARTIWGQSFDGTSNVSGNMTGVGSISASGDITTTKTGENYASITAANGNGSVSLYAAINRGVYTNNWLIGTNNTVTWLLCGNVGIGTASPSYKLDVNGYTKTTRLYLSDSIYLEVANNGVHVVGGGLYADTYVSALGLSSGSGGGTDMETVWTALANNTNEQINASHLTNALIPYATQSWVTQQIGSQDMSKYLLKFRDSGVVSIEGLGKNNYCKLATIKVVGAYVNTPIIFEVSGRARRFSTLQLLFNSISGTDPTVAYFISDNETVFWIKKTSTSTWEIYGQYNETWGTFLISRIITGLGTDRIEITTDAANIGYNLPDGCTRVSNLIPQGTVTAIMVGTTTYNPASGVVSLPAYPTKASWNYDDVYLKLSDSSSFKKTQDYWIPISGTWTTQYGDFLDFVSTSSNIHHDNNHNEISFYRAAHGENLIGTDSYYMVFSMDVDNTSYVKLVAFDSHSSRIYSKVKYNGTWEDWYTIAFTTDNVASATKLQTPRTIWGQSFDGTSNVSGNMTGVGSISASGDITTTKTGENYASITAANGNGSVSLYAAINRGVYTNNWLIGTNNTVTWLLCGNVGIGTASPSYKLDVNGTFYASGDSTIEGKLNINGSVAIKDSNDDYQNAITVDSSNNLILGEWWNKSGYKTFVRGETLTFQTSSTDNTQQNRLTIDKNGRIDVVNSSNSNGGLKIGNAILSWDNNNNALMVSTSGGGLVNFYATGCVSALGVGNINDGISGNLIPSANGVYTLGSGVKGWLELYLGDSYSSLNIYVNNHDAHYLSSGLHYFENQIYVDDKVSINGTDPNSDMLYVRGSVRSSGVSYASSHSNTSDVRLKEIIGYEEVSIETIARAPLVKFKWVDGDSNIHIGTIAQYWLGTELNNVVEQNDYLSMDYSTTALAGVITVARKVISHEERIKALEEENESLRKEIEILKS